MMRYWLCSALLIGALSANAQAALIPQGYAGASFGRYSDSSDACDDIRSDTIFDSLSCQSSASALRFFGGYVVNPYLSIEMGFVTVDDIVNITASFDETPTTFAGSLRGAADFTTLDIGAVGKYPISPVVSIMGLAGVDVWDAEFSDVILAIHRSPTQTERTPLDDDDGTDAFLGFGLAFKADDEVSLRFQIKEILGDADVQSTVFSALYKF